MFDWPKRDGVEPWACCCCAEDVVFPKENVGAVEVPAAGALLVLAPPKLKVLQHTQSRP